jgi:hypothetical protein
MLDQPVGSVVGDSHRTPSDPCADAITGESADVTTADEPDPPKADAPKMH